MAHQLLDPGREGILDRTIDMTAGTIKAALVRGYTFSSANKFISDLVTAGGSVVASVALTTKTYTSGVFDADDVVFAAVASGLAIETVIIFNDTGSNATSRLVCADTTYTGLPVTPNGGDIDVTWDNGTDKIFKL